MAPTSCGVNIINHIFTNEEPESQDGKLTCLRSYSQSQGQGLNPGLTLKTMLSSSAS